MTPIRETQLMHAVLDGVASPAEKRELERWLAGHPAAQAEFEALRGLFEHLKRLPELDPPADLAGQIVKKYAPREKSSRGAHKLLSWLRVSGISLPTTLWGETPMSEQAPARKRLIWAAVSAAVVAVGVGYFVFDIPATDQVSGTITPALRYRAEQPTAGDIKLDGKAGGKQTTPGQANDAGVAQAGGAQSGGAQSGGAQSGGAQSGGAQSGGAQSGGAQSGGAQSGGAQSGGAQSGGAQSGGAQSGGAQSGGAQSGGAQSGGAQSGGAQSGGAQSGGAQSGGAQSGGAQSGGAQSGGAQSGGAQSGAQSGAQNARY